MNFMLLAFSATSHGTEAPSTSGSDPGLGDAIVIMTVRGGDMIILDTPGMRTGGHAAGGWGWGDGALFS